jgi:hypothetical protein
MSVVVTGLSVFWYQVHGEYPFRSGVAEGMNVRNKLELLIIASRSKRLPPCVLTCR